MEHVTIKGTEYVVEPKDDYYEVRYATNRYHVQFQHGRHECTCGDFTFRERGDKYECKHIKAVRKLYG